jgi:ribulose kinase
VLLDPNALEEEESGQSLLTVCVDSTSKDLTAVFKDGSALGAALFATAAEQAYKGAVERAQLIRSLKEHVPAT